MALCPAPTSPSRPLPGFAAHSPGHNGPLACLTGTSMIGRFHFWRGASQRRYTASVVSIDPLAVDQGLPDFDGFVLIPVIRHGGRYWPLTMLAIERRSDRRAALAAALTRGANEWHVHLLGPNRESRRAIVEDLQELHFSGRQARSA